MDDNKRLALDPEFIGFLVKTQEEANRLGLKAISTFQLFSLMVYTPETYVAECLKSAGIKEERIESAMKKRWKRYVEKYSPKEIVPIHINANEIGVFDVNCDKDLYDLILEAPSYSLDGTIVSELTFMLAFFDLYEDKDVDKFLVKIGVYPDLIIRYYEGIMAEYLTGVEIHENNEDTEENNYQDKDFSGIEVPKSLYGCLTVLTADVSKPSPILERDKETDAVMKVLLKNKKRNCILVGNPGVGKTAIMEHLAWKIAKGECAEELKNKVILSLDVNGIIAGTKYRGMAEERFNELSNFLDSTDNIILYIDEIHTVLGAGNTSSTSLDLANSLKPILARENVAVVGATTTDEYEWYFNNDKAFKRRFETIMVEIPKYEKVYPMLKRQISNLRKIHGVSITRPVINYIIKIASCFNFETCNPDVSLDLIDKSMAAAKMRGAKVVTKEIVLSNFANEYENYNKISEEVKTSIAYHETGHFLLRRYANEEQKNSVLAVSIIPAEDYLGITVWDASEYRNKLWTYNELIVEIACKLGGRVAEKIYTGTYSAGASDDLDRATEEARAILLKYGMIPDFSKRNFEKDMDDEARKKLNDKIDYIINEGFNLAEKILKEHREILDNISKALVKNGILVDTDIEKICEEYEKIHKINKSEVKLV